MSWWVLYKKYIRKVVLGKEVRDRENVSYWRNTAFCEILIHLTPLSIIAHVPSVYMAFTSDIPVVGITDLFAFSMVVLIAVIPGIKIELRKSIFIFVLYCLSVILLYYLPLPAPGLLFLLVVTIFSSLIYSSSAAYLSGWVNTVICLSLGLLIYLEIETPNFSEFTLGAWMAVSSNLILLSFACAKCLDLLLGGLTKSLENNKISETKLEKANRLYQFISQINQNIVHVKDAKTLFRKSCDIALEFGKYKMAWIGEFDMAQRKIILLDSCGMADRDINLFTNIPYETNDAQEYVLRNGEYYLCNDMEQAQKIKNFAPYSEIKSIGSFIVLPIKKSGIIFGTFNLYASEINYFDDDDIALLKKVTGDISFALDLYENTARHKEAEIQLQKSFMELEAISKEQSALLNTLPASIALLDNKGNIVKVNEEWIDFGKSNGLLDRYPHIGKNYLEISENTLGKDEKEGKHMAQGLRQILSGAKEYFTMEYPCDSLTEKRWFKAEVRPFKSNLMTGAVVMHINISERKKVENEMILLINNTDEAFILLDKELQIISFNNQYYKLFKEYLGVEIRKGDTFPDYVRPHRKKLVSGIYEKVLQGNVEESENEFIIPGKTSYFSTKYSPAKDELGNIFGIFITSVDITNKKKDEEQKEFERRDKEALINSTDDLIWSISNDFKLIAANNSFVREMKELTGVDIKPGEDFMSFDMIPDASLQYWEGLFNRALLGESFKIEIHNPSSPGRDESWIEASFNPIIVNEQIAGIACYSRNITDRKKAEEKQIQTSIALQHAVNDLNKIMDSSIDIICTIDEEGKFANVSAASEDVLGYTPKELEGSRFMDFVFIEDVEITSKVAANIMSGISYTMFENRYKHKNGTTVPIIWSAKWDDTDKLMYCIAKDATDKKTLENALINERQRFYDLFSEAPTSMGVLSGPDHVFEFVNPLYLQLIGKKDIVGKTVKEVLPEAFEQGFIKLLDNVYKTGETFSTNEMLIKLDTQGTGQLVDKYLNFVYQAHRSERNTIDGIHFFAVDVTEQVVLRKKIENSEAKLKQAQALLLISNWEVDLVTGVSTWSDECYTILELSRDEIEPSLESILSMYHPDDYEFAKARIDESYQRLEAGSFSARIQTRAGKIKYVHSEWKYEFDSNGKPIRLYGILQDISDRKIAELERAKITNDLFQRNRDLEQFTFIISHNLRSPASNIIGLTEYLQDETLTPQEQKEMLKGLASSVSGLDTIIKDINTILQVKHEINEKKETILFSKLVADTLSSFVNTIETHNVQLHTDFSEVDELFSLKVYMQSIFYNLISNSIKYRKPDEQLHIHIKSKKENGKLILTFKDNGLGMDLKTKGDKVFGLYKRFHSHVEGKGMGLFMVKTQVETIGGKITVASEPNKGTEFTIVFDEAPSLLIQ